ncbi:hypothetical protein ACFL6C_09545, partial [Myxococcota bacterium]
MRPICLVGIPLLIVAGCSGSDQPDTPYQSYSVCGNNRIESGETCDRQDVGATCSSLGYGQGELGCQSNCRDYDRSECGAPTTCGDGTRQGVEKCDGDDLDSQTCQSLGYGVGILRCRETCVDFDISDCGPPSGCGDNQRNGIELCDGTDLGNASCTSLGLGEGNLGCTADCLNYDTSGCGSPDTCGNNQIDSGETCDGTALDAETCATLEFDRGTLACMSNCASYDTSDCSKCGNDSIETSEVCDRADLGGMTCEGLGYDYGDLTCSPDCQSYDESTCDLWCEVALAGQPFDIDIQTARITGTITLDGATLPDELTPDNCNSSSETIRRGWVKLTNQDTNVYEYIDLERSGPVT